MLDSLFVCCVVALLAVVVVARGENGVRSRRLVGPDDFRPATIDARVPASVAVDADSQVEVKYGNKTVRDGLGCVGRGEVLSAC